MAFRITGLAPEPFRPLFGLDDTALARQGAVRYRVDAEFGFPDRIELRDAAPGETVLLVNHVHQPADTPFRASHAIFVREGATTLFDAIDTVPDVLRRRMLSLRAFDAAHMMVDAALVDGREADAAIARLFTNPAVAYLHAHFATRGCYAARVDRAR
ncbi:DUF1203 domain-containing protein [Novilysobacter selenitireducens]|uniref:DUF1203 domain-containing protein n=1 Tax=Novilysobacter selenitireducens TaxID=2872639 RepID=A0ABS7T349_9GAMM|nr:DUF1203 domain-containing protein [Lysobacter selenitireducens]MBZ4038294.1 DUF1203 domain-containing protein [Lysobacter selenitireducens]